MSAVNRNLIMHTLILNSKFKDYAQPGLWGAKSERSTQVWFLHWVCSSSVICHAKHWLFASFFSISRWIKPAGIVIKHTTINLTFTETLVATRVYIIYINGMYGELKVKKLKIKTARCVCFIQEYKMVDLLIYFNTTKEFISIWLFVWKKHKIQSQWKEKAF